MAEESLPPGFKDSLAKAVDSWIEHHNALVRLPRGDREQFMSDIGEGWIVPEGFNRDAAEVGWGIATGQPKYAEALGMKGKPELSDPTHERQAALRFDFRRDKGKAGRYMGAGSLGTPVFLGREDYGASYKRKLDEGPYEGKLGVFAHEGRFVRSPARTGDLGHELGHAKQYEMEDPYVPKRKRRAGEKRFFIRETWNPQADQAAEEAVAGYLGRRIVKSKPGWGDAADDKSWATYSGLPSYLRPLDDYDLAGFLEQLAEYERQYPGIYEETVRAIKEYDTLVAPKTINDTSRGDWSEEGLKFMKEWRKKKGLKEVPKGSVYERALEMGPYSQVLRGASGARAV